MQEYTIHIELETNFNDLDLEVLQDYYLEELEELEFDN